MLVYSGGILRAGAGIAVDIACCCDAAAPPCNNCMTFTGFTVEVDDFLVDVALSSLELSPDPLCTNEIGTITFKILNSTGDAWPNDCPGPDDEDCSVIFDLFTATGNLEILSASAGGVITTPFGGSRVVWPGQSFAVGEEKTYSFTVLMKNCTVGETVLAETYYGRGYRSSITFECEACPPPPALEDPVSFESDFGFGTTDTFTQFEEF